jgi:hypothetical protein
LQVVSFLQSLSQSQQSEPFEPAAFSLPPNKLPMGDTMSTQAKNGATIEFALTVRRAGHYECRLRSAETADSGFSIFGGELHAGEHHIIARVRNCSGTFTLTSYHNAQPFDDALVKLP